MIKYSQFEKLLKEKGMTASDVAKATGISPSSLTDWKKGRYVPKADKLLKIADYFGVSVDYFDVKPAPTKNPNFTTREEKMKELIEFISKLSPEDFEKFLRYAKVFKTLL